MTGQEWEYERIPFETSNGQTVDLYSVVHQDYDGNGVVDGDDVAFVGDNGGSRVQNLPSFDGTSPKRDYHGAQVTFRKRFDQWQTLASVLYSSSTGIARRSFRQDFNVEGPMFYDDNWMGNLNYAVNNLEGPLPFTPTWEVKVSGSYSIPSVAVDVGARLRFMTGSTRVGAGELSGAHPVRRSAGRRDQPAPGCRRSCPSIPTTPTTSPTWLSSICTPRRSSGWVSSSRSTSSSTGSTSSTPTRPRTWSVRGEGYGNVTNIPQGRRFRFGVRFQF